MRTFSVSSRKRRFASWVPKRASAPRSGIAMRLMGRSANGRVEVVAGRCGLPHMQQLSTRPRTGRVAHGLLIQSREVLMQRKIPTCLLALLTSLAVAAPAARAYDKGKGKGKGKDKHEEKDRGKNK